MQQGIAAKRRRFGRPLYFDELPASGHHDVHVDFGFRVFFIREIEHRGARDDAHACGCNVVVHRNGFEGVFLAHVLQGEHQRHERAGD